MLKTMTTTALAAAMLLTGTAAGLCGEAATKAPAPAAGGAEEIGVEHGKLNTGDASPVDPGHFEVEVGYSYARSKRLWDKDEDTQKRELYREHGVSLAVTAGVVENVDVAIGTCYQWVRDDENDFDETDGEFGPRTGDHFGDLEFGGRWRFLNMEEHAIQMAYIAGFTAPTGSNNCHREIGTSDQFWSFNQALAASKDWGRLTANAEATYALPLGEHRDDDRGVLGLNLAAGYQALSWLQPELEVNYEREYEKEEADPELVAGTVGLVMPLSETFSVKTGVQEGLWGRNTDKVTTLLLVVKLAF